MIKYVVGFLFNQDKTEVVLIKKNRPDWQKGFLNGVGGKIEGDETPEMAMEREFEEEAGLKIKVWRDFCEIRDYNENYIVYFFYAVYEHLNDVVSRTDEKIIILNSDDLYKLKVIPNLRWLIPMCKDEYHRYSKTYTN